MPQIPLSERVCINCGKIGVKERKRCADCAKEYNRQRMKILYDKQGKYYYDIIPCAICKEPMKVWRKDQVTHIHCRYKLNGHYEDKFSNVHHLVRKLLKSWSVEVPIHYAVHHIDENPDNNTLENLCLLSVSNHNLFHRKLQQDFAAWCNGDKSITWEDTKISITQTWFKEHMDDIIFVKDKI